MLSGLSPTTFLDREALARGKRFLKQTGPLRLLVHEFRNIDEKEARRGSLDAEIGGNGLPRRQDRLCVGEHEILEQKRGIWMRSAPKHAAAGRQCDDRRQIVD